MERDLFKNKYRIQSTRLQGHDYSYDGWYFVTICTNQKKHFFGQVIDRKMVLNGVGRIVANEWRKTEKIRNNVFLNEWVVMPNHVHGILVIDNGMDVAMPTVETPCQGVSTDVAKQTNIKKHPGGHNSEWKSGTLGAIINQFKRQCTIQIRQTQNPNFAWQPRYYDHIIRNQKSLDNIRRYIKTNPQNWHRDRNNK